MTSCCRFTFNVSDWKLFWSSFRRFLHNPINHLWMRKVCVWEINCEGILQNQIPQNKITVVKCHVQQLRCTRHLKVKCVLYLFDIVTGCFLHFLVKATWGFQILLQNKQRYNGLMKNIAEAKLC